MRLHDPRDDFWVIHPDSTHSVLSPMTTLAQALETVKRVATQTPGKTVYLTITDGCVVASVTANLSFDIAMERSMHTELATQKLYQDLSRVSYAIVPAKVQMDVDLFVDSMISLKIDHEILSSLEEYLGNP